MQVKSLEVAGYDKVFYDHGTSGGKADRPGQKQALKHLAAGDMLIIYRLDQPGRSVLHLTDLLARLDNQDVQFWPLTEEINTATTGGKLIYYIFAALQNFIAISNMKAPATVCASRVRRGPRTDDGLMPNR